MIKAAFLLIAVFVFLVCSPIISQETSDPETPSTANTEILPLPEPATPPAETENVTTPQNITETDLENSETTDSSQPPAESTGETPQQPSTADPGEAKTIEEIPQQPDTAKPEPPAESTEETPQRPDTTNPETPGLTPQESIPPAAEVEPLPQKPKSEETQNKRTSLNQLPKVLDNTRFSTGFFIPLGSYSEIASLGLALYAEKVWPDLFVSKFYAGAKVGTVFMVVKPSSTGYNNLFPILATAGYSFRLNSKIMLQPKAAAGFSINSLSYENNEGEKIASTFALPHIEFGLEGTYAINGSMHVVGALLYNGMIEAKGIISAVLLTAGIGFSF